MTVNARKKKNQRKPTRENIGEQLEEGEDLKESVKKKIRGVEMIVPSFCYRILHNYTRLFEEAFVLVFQLTSLELITSGSPMNV